MAKRFITCASFILVLFSYSINCSAQARRRGFNYTEIGYLADVGSHTGGSLGGFRLRTGFSKFLNDSFALGFALGNDSFGGNSSSGQYYNTIPLTLTGTYFLNSELTGLHLDFYGGYAPNIFRNYDKGFTAGGGIAYGFSVSPGFILNAQTGYNYQQITEPGYSDFIMGTDLNINSIRVSVGLMFK